MFVPLLLLFLWETLSNFWSWEKIFSKTSFLTTFNFSHILSINITINIDYFVYNPVYLMLSSLNIVLLKNFPRPLPPTHKFESQFYNYFSIIWNSDEMGISRIFVTIRF